VQDACLHVYESTPAPEDAITAWRDLLKQDPNDKDAHANLGIALLNLNHCAEAVSELETAVVPTQPNSYLAKTLAGADLRAGYTDKAVAAFKEAAETALTPITWNEVAYTLADYNLSLSDGIVMRRRQCDRSKTMLPG